MSSKFQMKTILIIFAVRRNRREAWGYLEQWFPTFFDAFPPLLILELIIPPPLHMFFSFLPYYTSLCEYLIYQYILCHLPFTRHSVVATITKNYFTDDNNLINKSGTKTICCQIMALKFVNETCDSPLNNLQI